MDSAKELFDQIVEGGVALLESWVAERCPESEILEFKEASKGSAPMQGDDKRSLGEALSGFANSRGGVLVWGVSARMDEAEKIDAATELKPIKGLRRFLSDLRSNTPQVASPGVTGVEHKEIPLPDDADAGCIVSYIPLGQGEPQMATAGKQHRYYYRCGDVFHPMPAYMVADRYGRRPHPKLELNWYVRCNPHHIKEPPLVAVFWLKNVGSGTAIYPAVALWPDEGFRPGGQSQDERLRADFEHRRSLDQNGEDVAYYRAKPGIVLHPNTSLQVIVAGLSGDGTTDIRFSCGLYCDGYTSKHVETITAAQIRKAIDSPKTNVWRDLPEPEDQ